MNFNFKLLVSIGAGALLLVFAAFYNKEPKTKAGYIFTQQAFQQFTGTKELEKKFIKVQEKQKVILDSIALTIKAMESQPSQKLALQANLQKHQQLTTEFTRSNQEQYQEYSGALWKQINQYVSEYGKQKGYQIIHGADGSGTLMYADSTLNITNDIVLFINQKYAGN